MTTPDRVSTPAEPDMTILQPHVPDPVPVLAAPTSAAPADVAAAMAAAELAEAQRQEAGGVHGLPGGPAAGEVTGSGPAA